MGDSSSEDVAAGKSLRSLRLRPQKQDQKKTKTEQSPASRSVKIDLLLVLMALFGESRNPDFFLFTVRSA